MFHLPGGAELPHLRVEIVQLVDNRCLDELLRKCLAGVLVKILLAEMLGAIAYGQRSSFDHLDGRIWVIDPEAHVVLTVGFMTAWITSWSLF